MKYFFVISLILCVSVSFSLTSYAYDYSYQTKSASKDRTYTRALSKFESNEIVETQTGADYSDEEITSAVDLNREPITDARDEFSRDILNTEAKFNDEKEPQDTLTQTNSYNTNSFSSPIVGSSSGANDVEKMDALEKKIVSQPKKTLVAEPEASSYARNRQLSEMEDNLDNDKDEKHSWFGWGKDKEEDKKEISSQDNTVAAVSSEVTKKKAATSDKKSFRTVTSGKNVKTITVKKCTKCGAESTDMGLIFCPKDGQPLTKITKEISE